MNENQKLYNDLYSACLYAVKHMGKDIRTMSWFGQWKTEKR